MARLPALVALVCVMAAPAAGAPAAGALAAAPPQPPAVISTNLCADSLALDLAAAGQLHSVYWQSKDPRYSSFVARADAVPANFASAEEVLLAGVDVVLASRRWQRRMPTGLIEAAGTRVLRMPYAQDWIGIADSVMAVGAGFGRRARAAQLQTELARRLAALAGAGEGRSVLYLRPNGGSAGSGTVIDALFAAVGLVNHAEALGLGGWGTLSLEAVVANPPDVFMVGGMYRDASHARGAFLRHPSMRALLAERPVLRLSHSDFICSQWRLVAVAEQLEAALDASVAAVETP